MIDIDISYSFNSGDILTVPLQYIRDPNRRGHHVQSSMDCLTWNHLRKNQITHLLIFNMLNVELNSLNKK